MVGRGASKLHFLLYPVSDRFQKENYTVWELHALVNNFILGCTQSPVDLSNVFIIHTSCIFPGYW